MAVSHIETRPILKEWAPLTDLFTKLPPKAQNGIFFQEIKITCVDVLPEYLALGSNLGTVYWYDRRKRDMHKLQCGSNSPITTLKVISSVDYMVACGNKIGHIYIFQIPKSHPESIPENLRPRKEPVMVFIDVGTHKAPISAMAWSENGMKFFSGDKNGCIVFIEIDFYMNVSKSEEILNESYEVVQLSYKKKHLLVSTTFRSIICHKLDKWRVCQVGKKDRKMLGKFGGIIFQRSYKPSDICLYCTRPGLRMWISDIDGNVQKTLLFKEVLTKDCPEVPILNPISQRLLSLRPRRETVFGILLPFKDNLLVTYTNDVVYILDPQEMTILSTITQLRSVLNVATHKDEIFILEGDRSLIRISYQPESFIDNTYSSGNNSIIPSSLKNLTAKLRSTSIISAIPPVVTYNVTDDVNIHTDETMVVNAEEAQESPVKIRSHDPELKKKFDEIGKQEFEDKILFKQSKHCKKRSSMAASTSSLSSNSSGERGLRYTKATVINLSPVGILPDLRSPEAIKNDIENKEKLLAQVLNLDTVKMPDSKTGDFEREASQSERSQNNCEYNLRKSNNSKHELESKSSNKNIREGVPLEIGNSSGVTPKNKNQCDRAHQNDSLDDIISKNKNPHDEVTSKTKCQNDVIPKNKKTEDGVLAPVEFFGESSTESIMPNDMPACVSIPNEWGLSNIQVRERTTSVLSDNSLSDWEIV